MLHRFHFTSHDSLLQRCLQSTPLILTCSSSSRSCPCPWASSTHRTLSSSLQPGSDPSSAHSSSSSSSSSLVSFPPSSSLSHSPPPSAYLTNPTEISFRAYLTEQSFRHHLSHLDDLADDSAPESDSTLSRRNSTTDRATLPFHFANRASVSLRTPKHVFHSFGICTLATTRGAAVPASGRRASTNPPHRSDIDAFVSSDSWFIGAFGRWWRGGLVESWYYDAMIRSKDAQAWSSGILGFKALDKFHDYNGNFTSIAQLASN